VLLLRHVKPFEVLKFVYDTVPTGHTTYLIQINLSETKMKEIFLSVDFNGQSKGKNTVGL
jgi:hypothetical protein